MSLIIQDCMIRYWVIQCRESSYVMMVQFNGVPSVANDLVYFPAAAAAGLLLESIHLKTTAAAVQHCDRNRPRCSYQISQLRRIG